MGWRSLHIFVMTLDDTFHIFSVAVVEFHYVMIKYGILGDVSWKVVFYKDQMSDVRG